MFQLGVYEEKTKASGDLTFMTLDSWFDGYESVQELLRRISDVVVDSCLSLVT